MMWSERIKKKDRRLIRLSTGSRTDGLKCGLFRGPNQMEKEMNRRRL
jgi:hypothetical protein